MWSSGRLERKSRRCTPGTGTGVRGLCFINTVNEVTQYQFMAAGPRIGERDLLPKLESLLGAFPFKILGFHADNGSEYVNHKVAKLLNKLLVEFTLVPAPPRQRQRAGGEQARLGGAQTQGLRPHPNPRGEGGQRVPERAPVELPELSPALFLPRPGDRRQGPPTQALPP